MTQAMRAVRRYNVTSFDVAEEARVSQSTVSKALSGAPGVRSETRSRVLNAAKALGYHVDSRASGLRRLKVGCVALILVCNKPEQMSEEFGSNLILIRQVYDAVSALNFEMILSIQDPLCPKDDFISRRRADISIVIGRHHELTKWKSGVVRPAPSERFLSSGNEGSAWFDGQAFSLWLRHAVQTGAVGCEIILADAASNPSGCQT